MSAKAVIGRPSTRSRASQGRPSGATPPSSRRAIAGCSRRARIWRSWRNRARVAGSSALADEELQRRVLLVGAVGPPHGVDRAHAAAAELALRSPRHRGASRAARPARRSVPPIRSGAQTLGRRPRRAAPTPRAPRRARPRVATAAAASSGDSRSSSRANRLLGEVEQPVEQRGRSAASCPRRRGSLAARRSRRVSRRRRASRRAARAPSASRA